jgi:hypothetical protein
VEAQVVESLTLGKYPVVVIPVRQKVTGKLRPYGSEFVIIPA